VSGVAVVTTAHGRHDHLRRQRVSLAAGTVVPDVHVVVAMDDPAVAGVAVGDGPPVEVLAVGRDPLGLPLAAARNLGMAHAARAGCDVLIGLDVDCLAGPTMVAGYAATVRDDPATVWSGPVTYLPPPPPRGYDLGTRPARARPRRATTRCARRAVLVAVLRRRLGHLGAVRRLLRGVRRLRRRGH
jgi:GT2 family glycosyltransferase